MFLNVKNKRVISVCFVGIFLLGFFPNLKNISALEEGIFTDSFTLQTYDTRFYVTNIGVSEVLDINLSAAFYGEFDIFLFPDRPVNTYLTQNGYDPQIFNLAIVSNISVDEEN